MDLSTALLAALLCADVAAVALAVRSCGFDQGVADHLRKLVRVLRVAAQKLARAGDIAIVERAANVKHDRLEVGGHAGSIAAAGESRKANRTLLALLTFALADELAQAALHAALDGAPRPLAGWYRAGWHVSIALSLGWPAALAWVAGHKIRPRSSGATSVIKSDRSSDPLLGAYLGALAGLAIVYPPSRAGLRWTLLAWELACVGVAWWGLWRARLRTWGAAEVCLVVLVSCESAVVIVGPFASDPFTRWWIARAFYLGAWLAVIGALIKANRAR